MSVLKDKGPKKDGCFPYTVKPKRADCARSR